MADAEVRGILSPNEYRRPMYRVVHALAFVVAVALAVVMLYPVLWVFLSAIKTPAEIYRNPPTLFPSVADWENFAQAWKSYEIPRMFLNTTLVFLGFIASRLFVVTTAAYALSRLDIPFRRTIYLIIMSTLALPTFAYLIPSYLVIKDLGLYDSWWALWVPAGANAFQILIVKNFFDGIPRELSEASRMDGASEVRILWSVVLPLSRPVIAAISIFSFLEVWNNFFWQRLVFNDPHIWTMPVMLYFKSFTIGGNPPINVQLAGMFISLIPPLLIFLFFQRNITNGVTMSGIKE
jgi:ABC-type glycerol-3-phosphate transport system permease component